jgi:exonuclease III
MEAISMRLVSWNCCDGLRQKYSAIADLNPDILILQEVRRTDLEDLPDGTSFQWVGLAGKKGLAVLGRNGWSVDLGGEIAERWFLPVVLARGDVRLRAVGVWSAKADGYARPTVRAMEALAEFLLAERCFVVGDFNASSVFDKKYPAASHFARIVQALESKGLRSAWHHFRIEQFGAESTATFHMYRQREKAYHLDYAFLSSDLLQKAKDVRLGSFEDWVSSGRSDHVPLVIDFES